VSLNATLIAQIVVFFILAWFTMTFVWPPITKALASAPRRSRRSVGCRQGKASSSTRTSVREQLAAAAPMRPAPGRCRAPGAVDDRRSEVARQRRRREDRRAAKAEAEQEAIKVREQLRDQVAALAVKGAEQILRKEVNADVHAGLLAQLKTEL